MGKKRNWICEELMCENKEKAIILNNSINDAQKLKISQ
jgi:hypothetical protein